jgi:hypothetical protein
MLRHYFVTDMNNSIAGVELCVFSLMSIRDCLNTFLQ